MKKTCSCDEIAVFLQTNNNLYEETIHDTRRRGYHGWMHWLASPAVEAGLGKDRNQTSRCKDHSGKGTDRIPDREGTGRIWTTENDSGL